jgi:hypothetical protein
VKVDAGDLGDQRSQPSGERTFAAANVKRSGAPGRHDPDDEGVVVEVMVPPLLVRD